MTASCLTIRLRRFLRPPRRYIYLVALVMSAFRYVLIRQFFPQFNAEERLLFSGLSLLFMILVWEGINAFNEYLNRRLPFESGVLRRFIVQAGSCLVVLIALQRSLITGFEHYYVDYFPLQMANAIKVASYGLNVFLVVGVNTAYFGFYFFEKWKKNLLEKEKWEKEKAVLQKQRLTAQYENLTNQLNPHFLFNSLSSLDGLIDENPALARQFLHQLSRVYRYVLQHKQEELVTLDTELQFIHHYVSLLHTRFDGALSVRFGVAGEVSGRLLVPVTLQILLENVIKHNIISEAQPLTVQVMAGDTYLDVTNPIQRKRQVATSHGRGLDNLQQLYRFLSPNPLTVHNDGVTFRVRVPLLTSDSVSSATEPPLSKRLPVHDHSAN